MITFDDGRISTCRLPRFSALVMFLRQSFKTLIRTMVFVKKESGKKKGKKQRSEGIDVS